MRKAVLILFISVILSAIIFLIYILSPLFKTTPSNEKVPFDKYLQYNQWNLMFEMLQKMGYMISIQQYDYLMDPAGCIVIEDVWNEENFIKFKKWFKKNKRLIVFLKEKQAGTSNENENNSSDESQDETGKGEGNSNLKTMNTISGPRDLLNISVNSSDPLLKDVHRLKIDGKSVIDSSNFEYTDKEMEYSTILRVNGNSIIRKAVYHEAEILFISDGFMFSDKNILKEDNAVLLNNLFKDYYHSLIVFDETKAMKEQKRLMNLHKKESFLTMGSFPYIVLQLLILGIVFFLAHYKRFGNILDFNQYKKRSVRNHIQAVGNFLLNSGSNRALADIFDEYFFEKLARLFPGRNLEELISELRNRYKGSGEIDIFQRNQVYNLALIEMERYKFIKIIEKGEDYGKKAAEKKS